MRGISLDGLGVTAGAALFGLAIFIGPMLVARSDQTQDLAGIASGNPFADERWDGEWEHRPVPAVDQRIISQELIKSIDNIGRTEPKELAPTPANVEEARTPPTDPILRIDSAQHSGPIWAIDVDAKSRLLVTASADKTARIWAIPQEEDETFKLVRVIRPPLGEADEGKLYAVAISPDGTTIAVGGATGLRWSDQAYIYIFDVQSGRLKNQLSGFPGLVFSLAYSKDGAYLAAGLTNRNGVRVWRSEDWSAQPVIGQDEYGDHVFGLSFAADGRLAVGSFDGAVRIYSPDFQQVDRRVNALEGDRIYRIAFSPTGDRLAVASSDKPKISILDSKTLETLYRPDTSDLPQRARHKLSIVTWSQDGDDLIATGHASSRGPSARMIVRRYEEGGKGAFKDIMTAENTMQGLRAVPHGVVFGSQDPAIGLVNAEGTSSVYLGPSKTDVRGTPYETASNIQKLRVSEDGMSVSLPFDSTKQNYWRFAVNARRMSTMNAEAEDLFTTKLHGLNIQNWNSQFGPRLDSVPLRLRRNEMSRDLAIAQDNTYFVIGTEYYLRVFEADGTQRWAIAGPSIAYRVNVSRDGKLALAYFNDGTVRWYDMRNGDELLALFVTNEPENPRWVAWTPSGYYDASPGAEDLIGWHINQGADQEALFFPASRFRELYYRPEIIRNVLKTRTVEDPPSREKLLAAAPPIITILGERVLDNGDVVVDYEARTIFGEEIELEVYVDDAKLDLAGARYAVAPAERQSLTVPRGGCARNLSFVVKTADGRRSEAETITRGGAAISTNCAEQDNQKPNLHALIIGVSDYARNSLDLDFAHQDAEDFAKLLKAQEGNAFEKVTITTLTDDEATKGAIEGALAALQDNVDVTSNDATVFFFAGHGVKRSQGGNALFFLPHNADMSRLASTAVNQTRFVEAVTSRVGRKFIFLDACFSNFGEQSGLGLFDMQGIANTLGGSDIRAEVFSSSTGDQVSFEHEDWENGAFTEALLEGLQGGADYTGDDNVTNDELNLFVKSRVRSMVREKHGAVQTPTYTAAGSIEFPLAHVYE